MQLVVVTPVFEDWESFARLVFELDRALAAATELHPLAVSVLAVDDGSISDGPTTEPDWSALGVIGRVDVLRMAANMGHQRAIALGMVQVAAEDHADVVVIMDADGEDRPEDVVRLVRAHREHPGAVILAQRSKRSESAGFRLGYWLYRWLFRVLTGQAIRFGNFSLMPRPAVARLVANADIWNHLAAAVSRSRLPVRMVPTERGARYAGHSHMSWVSLVTHGLSAMSVHSDRVATRLILASAAVTVMAVLAIVGVVCIKLFTDLAIPGWASQTVGLLGLASLISVATASLLAFLTLQARQRPAFLPKTDGLRYIQELERWHPKTRTDTSAPS